MTGHHILVVGAGSVGRRHLRNLHSLGCSVSCVDPRPERLDQAGDELPVTKRFATLEDALKHGERFSGVAICSPPRFHVSQSLAALEADLPVLLEKPVAPDLASCRQLHQRLQQSGTLLLGYTYRWWPPVRRLKTLIEEERVGTPRHVRFFMSAHLADWHPWEPYQSFFMASRELGGGALLDESHFIDLMLWFFTMPERIFARVEKISELEIDTDDFVEISAVYNSGLRVSVHLDLFGRPHEKHIVVVGERGSIQCLFDPDQIRIGDTAEAKWTIESFVVERNDMFMAVAQEFLRLIGEEPPDPSCTILDGLKTLRIIEACRESQSTGREVKLSSANVD
jgi:predicted dehydrogenase